jgi:hypothetical protein
VVLVSSDPHAAGTQPRPSTSDERTDPSGAKLGVLIHSIVQELLVSGVRMLDPATFFSFIAQHPLVLKVPQSQRQSLKQRLTTAVASYFRFFVPLDGWRLVGVEVRAPGCVFDVVWETDNGEIVVDEIKAGRLQTRPEREAVESQIARELAGGTRKWDERFCGIRLLWLGAPLHSVLVQPNGKRTAIYEGRE